MRNKQWAIIFLKETIKVINKLDGKRE